jgi:hypothetical protein
MLTIPTNPSRIRHNPSRICDGFGSKNAIQRDFLLKKGKSVTNPSHTSVTDFGKCKSIFNKNIYIFISIYLNPSHLCPRAVCAHARGGCDHGGHALGPVVRAVCAHARGGCDGFGSLWNFHSERAMRLWLTGEFPSDRVKRLGLTREFPSDRTMRQQSPGRESTVISKNSLIQKKLFSLSHGDSERCMLFMVI